MVLFCLDTELVLFCLDTEVDLEEEECYNPRNSKENKTINCYVEPVNSLTFLIIKCIILTSESI